MVRGSVRRVRLSTGRPTYSRRVEFCGVRDVQGDEAGTKNYFGLGSGKCFFANGNVEPATRSWGSRAWSCVIPGPPPSRGNGTCQESRPYHHHTTPAEAGVQLGDVANRAVRIVTATFPFGPRPSPGWKGRVSYPLPLDDRADLRGEGFHGERLGDHRHARLEKARRQRCVFRIAGHEQHAQPGTHHPAGIGDLAAVEPG